MNYLTVNLRPVNSWTGRIFCRLINSQNILLKIEFRAIIQCLFSATFRLQNLLAQCRKRRHVSPNHVMDKFVVFDILLFIFIYFYHLLCSVSVKWKLSLKWPTLCWNGCFTYWLTSVSITMNFPQQFMLSLNQKYIYQNLRLDNTIVCNFEMSQNAHF